VIPAKAETVLEFKVLPYTEVSEITAYLDRNLEGLPVSYEIMSYEDGFESHFDNSHLKELVAQLNAACERYGFTGQVLPMLALGRTDGRFFGSEGSMVYGCSPLLMGDSFDVVLPKVHGHNESILETSFQFGCQVLHEIIEKNCLTGGAK
jgi:acetylornithine deacetylase/succinyl-diaminopimelate desuccinylase-like protein